MASSEAMLINYINSRFDMPRYKMKSYEHMSCAKLLEHKLTKSKVLVYIDLNNKIYEKLLN